MFGFDWGVFSFCCSSAVSTARTTTPTGRGTRWVSTNRVTRPKWTSTRTKCRRVSFCRSARTLTRIYRDYITVTSRSQKPDPQIRSFFSSSIACRGAGLSVRIRCRVGREQVLYKVSSPNSPRRGRCLSVSLLAPTNLWSRCNLQKFA